jgi:Flp pilus assembly protein TadD
MRFLRLLPFLLLLPAGSLPITPGVVAPEVDNPTVYDPPPAQKLKTYFEALARSGSAEEAARFEGEIYLIMTRNPSPTITFLMESATMAIEADDKETARMALTRVTELDPTYAEGLARLATVVYDDGDLVQAEALLKRALRLEPRHFAAWTGLGLVREDLGDFRGAEAAYREALFYNPYLDGAKRGLIRMEARLDGLSL